MRPDLSVFEYNEEVKVIASKKFYGTKNMVFNGKQKDFSKCPSGIFKTQSFACRLQTFYSTKIFSFIILPSESVIYIKYTAD